MFAELRSWVSSLGAEAIAVAPELHDAMVAVVSHVPQLAASTLMNVANQGTEEHAVLLRLAAGGFRDMTRIASSHPAIWPDICLANRDAIVGALDAYLDELTRVRSIVAGGDRDALAHAPRRCARRRGATCPPACRWRSRWSSCASPSSTAKGSSPRSPRSRRGSASTSPTSRSRTRSKGRAGVLVLVVAERNLDAFEAALQEHGYHVARTPLA